MAQPYDSAEDFKDLCYHIGFALLTWQNVELAHLILFLKMLGASNFSVSSVVYYNTESFDARNRMLNNMASVFLSAEDKTEWDDKPGLYKAIKDANLNRNKLAHYDAQPNIISIEELPDGEAHIVFGEDRLQPSPYNIVSRIQNKKPENPEHNLGVAEIKGYIDDWQKLAKRITTFSGRFPWKPHQEGIARLFGPLPDGIAQSLQSLEKSAPPDTGPSGQ